MKSFEMDLAGSRGAVLANKGPTMKDGVEKDEDNEDEEYDDDYESEYIKRKIRNKLPMAPGINLAKLQKVLALVP